MAGLRDAVRRLGLARTEVEGLPEAFAAVSATEWSNGWQEAVVAACRALPEAIDALLAAGAALGAATGVAPMRNEREDFFRLWRFVATLLGAYGHDLRFAFAPNLPDTVAAAAKALDLIDLYRQEEEGLSARYAGEAVRRIDLPAVRMQWLAAAGKIWPLSYFGKRRVGRTLAEHGGVAARIDVAADLPRLEAMHAHLAEFDALAARAAAVPGIAGIASRREPVAALCALAESLRQAIAAAADDADRLTTLRRAAATLVLDANDLLVPDGAIARAHRALGDALTRFDIAVVQVQSLGASLADPQDLAALRACALTLASQQSRLRAWTGWRRARNEASAHGLEPLVVAVEGGAVAAADAASTFETAYAHWFARTRIDAEPLLSRFASSDHMDAIETFRRLDADLSRSAARYIRARISGAIPQKEGASRKDGYAVLKHQNPVAEAPQADPPARRRNGRRLHQARPLHADEPALDRPVSAARPGPVRPRDLRRGVADRAVGRDRRHGPRRAGDRAPATPARCRRRVSFPAAPRQATAKATPRRIWKASSTKCLAAGLRDAQPLVALSQPSREPHRLLEPSLLRQQPRDLSRAGDAPQRRRVASGSGGLRPRQGPHQRHRGEGPRQRGGAPAPRPGLRRCGRDARHHHPQCRPAAARREPPRPDPPRAARIESHFAEERSEPVVVKNLETVQGDERDVMLLGIGFGTDEPGGTTMSMSFGALNGQGGWRRLNVAITRARQEMAVFTSFDPGMIDLNRTSAQAVRDLKHFIEFADRGPGALARAVHGSVGGHNSPFEQAVAQELARRGWTVVPQIGVSRFRIDLGIVHPDRPGDFLVGIECDGATYHSAATARDRDRVRAAILEGPRLAAHPDLVDRLVGRQSRRRRPPARRHRGGARSLSQCLGCNRDATATAGLPIEPDIARSGWLSRHDWPDNHQFGTQGPNTNRRTRHKNVCGSSTKTTASTSSQRCATKRALPPSARIVRMPLRRSLAQRRRESRQGRATVGRIGSAETRRSCSPRTEARSASRQRCTMETRCSSRAISSCAASRAK